MSVKPTQGWLRFAEFAARIIVRLWPEETRDWGRAFAAELSEIETPLASFRWLVGGLMLLTRERFRHFARSLGRPLGVPALSPLESVARKPSRIPRAPRIVTALLLLVSLAILCLPEVRTSLGSVASGYFHGDWNPSRWRSIQKLRKEAQTNRDPQLLVFLSLLADDPKDRTHLAGEAIARDPSLAWIDYVESYWNFADPDRQHFLSDEKIARLQEFDPGNAVPLLLNAEIISHPVQLAYFATTHDSALTEDRAWEHEIAKNPAWLAAMDRAFAATKYDDYWSRQLDLLRVVSDSFHLSDTDVAFYILVSHRLIDYEDIDAYADLLLQSGEEAARRGNTALAAASFEKVEHFAQLIRARSNLSGDTWLAAEIGTKSAQKLQSLFESTGEPAQRQLAAAQLAGWQNLKTSLRMRPHPWFERHWSRSERAALLINLAVLLICILFPIVVLTLLSVGFAASSTRKICGHLYPFVCLAADATPILLASSFALLFFAYHPYADFYHSQLAANPTAANIEDILSAARVTHNLPWTVRVALQETFDAYHFWLTSTLALAGIAAWLIFRMTLRRRTV